MKAFLTTEITIHRVSLFAEMAWLERRPELGMLCRAARDQDHRLTEAIVQSVLPGLTEAGARNVLRWCETLGLCDRYDGLTSLGQDVAETDEAPVPEQGVYRLWLARHPVIGSRALAVERISTTRQRKGEGIGRLPVEPDLGRRFDSVVDTKERFIVRDLPRNHGDAPGGLVEHTPAQCRLRWTLDFDNDRDTWTLDGFIDAPVGRGHHEHRQIQHEPESDGLDLWRLAETWGKGPLTEYGHWRADDRQLEITFTGLDATEITDFKKTFRLDSAKVPGKGLYRSVDLEDVPIAPATGKDAQKWAEARFAGALLDTPVYRSRSQVRTLFAELVEDTPLERHSPVLPSHNDLLESLAGRRDQFWGLAAAVDLAPRPVSPEDLDSFQCGVSAPAAMAEPASTGIVRIPYRGGWSMRQLVDRLFAGSSPRRVLLCDRYVRGEGNLRTLGVLVAAVRAAAAKVDIEVWTAGEEADFARIRAFTGCAPRSYREVFGRATPHDRYLVVRARDGEHFGWHLSNSPLHARADVASPNPGTPLRWKDLLGTRVSAEQLEPALRQWAKGRAP